jgi:uncharacterized protein (TIGR03435 family)
MNSQWLYAVANHLWQSTVVAGVAGVLALMLKRYGAHVRYWIWFAASVKFLVPFALLMSLGNELTWRSAPVTNRPSLSLVVTEVTQPFQMLSTPNTSLVATTGSVFIRVPTVLFAIWLVGVITVLLLWVRSWLRITKIVKRASPLMLTEKCAALVSQALLEPSVFGVCRPVLLLPQGIEQRLSREQLHSVIAHELCHIRRRDNLLSAVHMSVAAIFWFYPVVWWIGSRLLVERERACDEQVLRQGNDAQAYAEGIVRVCKSYLESSLQCASGVGRVNLQRRIEGILSGRVAHELRVSRMLLLAMAAVFPFAVPIGVGMMNASPSSQNILRPADTPKWEAVSIKPCMDQNNGGRGRGGGPSPGRLNMPCFPVKFFIQSAYDLFASGHGVKGAITSNSRTVPIEGGPSWINSDLYEITAKAEGTPARETMQGPMLQALLEDRFHLRIHREIGEMPLYALTVAKGGPKLEPFEEGSCFTPQPGTPLPPPDKFRPCGGILFRRNGPVQILEMWGMTLGKISQNLTWNVVDRQVIDKTGIAGTFNIHLEFAPDTATPGGVPGRDGVPGGVGGVVAADPSGPSIFTAIQEQLGLKLEATRGPGQFLVIDSIERPTEN